MVVPGYRRLELQLFKDTTIKADEVSYNRNEIITRKQSVHFCSLLRFRHDLLVSLTCSNFQQQQNIINRNCTQTKMIFNLLVSLLLGFLNLTLDTYLQNLAYPKDDSANIFGV